MNNRRRGGNSLLFQSFLNPPNASDLSRPLLEEKEKKEDLVPQSKFPPKYRKTYKDENGVTYFDREYYILNPNRNIATEKEKRLFIVKASEIIGDRETFLADKRNFRTILSPFIDDYEIAGDKTGGINFAGAGGGNKKFHYTIDDEIKNNDNPTRRCQVSVMKQDTGYTDFRRIINKIPIIPNAWRWFSKNILQKLLFKKIGDIFNDGRKQLFGKIIGEYVAARVMNKMIGNSASSVFYTTTNTDENKQLDLSGKSIYLCSPFYDGYSDFYKDVDRIQGRKISGVHPGTNHKRLNRAGSTNNDIFKLGLLKTNENNEIIFFDHAGTPVYTTKFGSHWNPFRQTLSLQYKDMRGNPITEEAALKLKGKPACRYHYYSRACLISLFMGDFDIHTGNLGILAKRKPREIEPGLTDKEAFLRDALDKIIEDADGKIGYFVKIDHGAAFHHLPDKVNLHSRADHPWGFGPTNHYREFPRDLRISKETAEEADYIANFDKAELRSTVTEAMNETGKWMGAAPIADYVEHLGMHVKELLQSSFTTIVNLSEKSKKMPFVEFYNTLMNSKFSAADDACIKQFLINKSIEFQCQKLYSRQESFRREAYNIKMSLCIKYKSDGSFEYDTSDYNIDDVLKEYPEYVTKNIFEMKSHVHDIDVNKAATVAKNTLNTAILKTAEHALKTKFKSKSKNVTVAFYEKASTEAGIQNQHTIPDGISQMIITDQTRKHSSSTSDTVAAFKAENTTINYVKSESNMGRRGYYIEHITKANEYEITAQRLPPEINKTAIFTQFLLKKYPAALQDKEKITKICRKLQIKNNTIDVTLLKDEQSDTLNKYSIQLDQTLQLNLINAYNTACKIQVGGIEIPTLAYLNFAKKHCESLRLATDNKTITIFRSAKADPLLIQAYILVCNNYGWKYNDKSKCDKTIINNMINNSAVTDYVKNNLPADGMTNTNQSLPIKNSP